MRKTFRRIAERGFDADCFCELADGPERNLGDGLRWSQPACRDSLRSIALTPRWSPDSSRIAFTCFAYAAGVTGAADLHALAGFGQADCVSSLQGDEQRTFMVAGRDAMISRRR